ncbi:MAG TPA: hypothetical protein VIC62_12000 [Nakamurella sp.]|jgi:hypothetical protein
MTTTPPTPTITPCPEWCDLEARHPFHERDVLETDDHGRTHRASWAPTGHGVRDSYLELLWTEVPEDPDYRTPVVIVYTTDLTSMDAAATLIADLQEAADLAFGTAPVGAGPADDIDQDEFDAASTEIMQWAEHPTDLNRLVAAAIRFRNAFLGADEVTR